MFEGLMQFIGYGFADNAILLVGALTGLSLDNLYGGKGKGTVIGALLGNTLSDGLAGIIVTNVALGIGSAIGCFIVLVGYLLYLKLKTGESQCG